MNFEEQTIVEALNELIGKYRVQSQFSVPFLLEQIRLVESNNERVMDLTRRFDRVLDSLIALERGLELLKRRVDKMETRQNIILGVIIGDRKLTDEEIEKIRKAI